VGDLTNVPPGLSNVVAIAASNERVLVLKQDGTVFSWGNNNLDAPTGLSNVVAIAAGPSHSLALQNDGTVVGWGDDSSGQIDIPNGLTNVVAIAAGYNFSLALVADGALPASIAVSNPAFHEQSFSLSAPTFFNHAYGLESSDSLTPSSWNLVNLVPGDGTPRQFSDRNAVVPLRFYCVRMW
jgi:alpha-tubulin suppressor-like RCC1 family protein